VTVGAGVPGNSATRPEIPAPAVAPQQPAADPGPIVIPIEVVDPEGHGLSGVDVVATIG
jgi:hypothetical protein